MARGSGRRASRRCTGCGIPRSCSIATRRRFSSRRCTASSRPDGEATRRAAYQPLLGMDLNHGTSDNKPYPFVRAEAANKEFVSDIRGAAARGVDRHHQRVEHERDQADRRCEAGGAGQEAAGDAARAPAQRQPVARGVRQRRDDVVVPPDGRRRLAPSSSICARRRRAPEQRLFKIAQLVGVPAHGLSGSYFDIADEHLAAPAPHRDRRLHCRPATAWPRLYTPGSALERVMRTIITHWSIITGRDMKAGKIAPTGEPPAPLGLAPRRSASNAVHSEQGRHGVGLNVQGEP